MLRSDNDMLQRRNRELSILNTIAEAMNREIDLRQALRTALAQAVGLLDLQTGWIWLLDEDSAALSSQMCRPVAAGASAAGRVCDDGGDCHRCRRAAGHS